MWAAGAHTVLHATLDLSLSAELSGEWMLASSGAPGSLPAEGLMALHWGHESWMSTIGLATGLSKGVGSPDYRIVAGIRYQPHANPTSHLAPEPGQTLTQIRVVDEQGQSIHGARIELLDGPEEELGRWTAELGELHRNLIPGQYRVLVEAAGYGALTSNVAVPEQSEYRPEPLTLFDLGEQSQLLFLLRTHRAGSSFSACDQSSRPQSSHRNPSWYRNDYVGTQCLQLDDFRRWLSVDHCLTRVDQGSTASII